MALVAMEPYSLWEGICTMEHCQDGSQPSIACRHLLHSPGASKALLCQPERFNKTKTIRGGTGQTYLDLVKVGRVL